MTNRLTILLRVRIAYVFVLLFSFGILYKIVRIQTVDGGKWKKKAEAIGLQYRNVKATRGNIYSDNESLLATSLPFYKLAIDPSIASDKVFKSGIDSLSRLLSRHFKDLSAQDYKRRINDARIEGRRYLRLNRQKINYLAKKEMNDWPIFREGRMKGGVLYEKVDERFHPFSYLGYRTIGTTDEENRGVVGLEYSFNQYLMGKSGKALYQKFSGGSWKPVFDGTEVKPQNGLDIVSTINVDLQDVAESALVKALYANDADYGCVVVMEVATGEIKAISNLSKNSRGEYWENYNYAVGSQGSREPGSTFKLASMIALFEESRISLLDTVDTGDGEMAFYDQVMKDHKPGGYGKLSVQEVFEKSSNIGTAKLIVDEFGDNPKRYTDLLEKMGLTKPLGFQMVGEGKPYIKTPEDSTWSGVSLPWISHGYELTMTPLHTLTLYNAVANNGKMIQPLIVKQVKTADRVVEEFKSKVINPKICSDITLVKVKEMLEGVVTRGTASNISDSYYQIAGKTGTAKHVVNGRYTSKYYTSFAGYFPAEKPKYSAIVVIDNPKSYRIYGSDVAAPVFKDIADKIYAIDMELNNPFEGKEVMAGIFPVIRAGHQEELKEICNEFGISNHIKGEATWTKASISNNAIAWKPLKYQDTVVPDVRGMTLRDALFILENKHIKVKYSGLGRVTDQSVLPGVRINDDLSIELKLG
ncbi:MULTISPECIES: penicillin-binding protein [Reichenbachiella]|uniref:Cell division protein FtsI (Penicillin-binding protein 3) n=1 Tax=Reichenbachiella agariperforans TaxID=156994 RepID=A0A1M6LK92_REIAG|nr:MULTISPECIES: penicillin-binding protein [Reichenbachiella]MBU2913955.1 transpeptidase family protein [Reichenbachiella agariperforans]RJE74136.1 cell division protein [Reichenbachiella sp. MSK19-1]SHJ71565.1 cell division protein FtsI (penicillin-binding protein 3) [Reichenbachiella agariperforans]